MTATQTDYTTLLIQTALKAGKAILDIYESGDTGVEYKEDDSPLTKADKASHEIIVAALQSTGLPILSEEGKDIPYDIRKHWTSFWLVDPLDGTKEFIKRNGEFTVNIALIESGSPVFGLIYAPVLKLLYYGGPNLGSFRTNAASGQSAQEILMQSERLPIFKPNDPYRVVVSRSHMNTETEAYVKELEAQYGQIRYVTKGSSLKLCLVAEGSADCYPRFGPTMEWDIGAGDAVCQGSGKTASNIQNAKEILYNKESLLNPYFIVN